MTTSRDDRITNYAVRLLAVCTVVLAVAVAHREFFPNHAGVDEQPRDPVRVSDWRRVTATGHRIGAPTARVTLVVFSDFECPFCRRFARGAMAAVLRQYPNDVAVLFRHFPLPMHTHAYPTARASECAASQGSFERFHDLLFEKQDSLGSKSFRDLARESGVPSLKAFDECNSKADSVGSISDDISEARRLGVRGTPTIIANGWMLRAMPDSARLDSLVRKELQRR